MINEYKEKNGVYPDKLGIILWSTETQRNEGVNESAALHLLGDYPGVGQERPGRGSGAHSQARSSNVPGSMFCFRRRGFIATLSPRVIKLLDRAVHLAGSLKDVENFVAVNNQKDRTGPSEKGVQKR